VIFGDGTRFGSGFCITLPNLEKLAWQSGLVGIGPVPARMLVFADIDTRVQYGDTNGLK